MFKSSFNNTFEQTTSRTFSSSFRPADLPGLRSWHDATVDESITESAGSVSQWDDLTGNAHHLTQGNASRQPSTGVATINGRNALNLDTDFMGLPASVDVSGKTLFMVIDQDDTSMSTDNRTNKGLWASNTWSNYANHITLEPKLTSLPYSIFIESAAGQVDRAVVLDNAGMAAPMILSIRYKTSSSVIKMNDTEKTIGRGAGTTNLRYLGMGYGSGNYAKTAVGEIIMYDRILHEDEFSDVEQYLNSKWRTF